MAIFYVYQNQTYEPEHDGGYIWSPQKNKNGHKNKGYEIMTEICKGDFIIHHANTAIQAISVAKYNCYKADQPYELKTAKTDVNWNDEGYRVDVDYVDFDEPLKMSDKKIREWLENNRMVESAFNKNGKGKQQYMCHVPNEHVRYLLQMALKNQQSLSVKKIIERVLLQVE